MQPTDVCVRTGTIKLDSFLKLAGVVQTGGQAKAYLTTGKVLVNGQPETRRGRKLIVADVVLVDGIGAFRVTAPEDGDGRNR